MAMVRITSFRSRVFAALLAVAVVPTALALIAGALAIQQVGSTTGTLGPWDAVAESGRELVSAARAAAPSDTAVDRAARAHTEALSAGVRQSRLYSLVTDRAARLLPWLALAATLVLSGVAAWVARLLARNFSAPIHELVDWTERIAAGEPLPPERGPGSGVREYRVLRRALRNGAARLETARKEQVESARLRAWTEMARRVAHEIKNPLTPMRMSASTLARNSDPKVREAAEILLEEVRRLDDMARSFARFGRPPDGPPAAVDLVELGRGVVEGYDSPSIRIRFRASPGVPQIQGHHDILGQALRNLVVNAVEALSEGSGSQIEVAVTSTSSGVQLTVRDDGPGIPPELIDEMWLPDVTTRQRGSGLGLAMVRRAAEIHGGSAIARNRLEGGAEFELRLPLAPPDGSTASKGEVDPWTS
jgi:nitrogen fixation/metabolism regulation signal transduction histidine kinase